MIETREFVAVVVHVKLLHISIWVKSINVPFHEHAENVKSAFFLSMYMQTTPKN